MLQNILKVSRAWFGGMGIFGNEGFSNQWSEDAIFQAAFLNTGNGVGDEIECVGLTETLADFLRVRHGKDAFSETCGVDLIAELRITVKSDLMQEANKALPAKEFFADFTTVKGRPKLCVDCFIKCVSLSRVRNIQFGTQGIKSKCGGFFKIK